MLISFTAEVATRSWDTNRSERQLIDHAVVCVCHLQVNIGSNFLKFEFYNRPKVGNFTPHVRTYEFEIFFSREVCYHLSINRLLKACLHTVHYLSVFQLKLWGVSCSSINCNPPEFLVKFRAKITGRYFLQGMLPKTSSNRWRRRLKRYSEARRSGLRNSQSSQVHFSYNCYWKLEVWQLNVSFHYFRSRSKTIRSRSP